MNKLFSKHKKPEDVDDQLAPYVKKLQRGYNREAFKFMHDKIAGRLYATIVRYVGEEELAKDTLQEVLVTIFEKIKTFEGRGSFEGWCKKIATFASLKALRSKKVNFELIENVEIYDSVMIEDERVQYTEGAKIQKAMKDLPTGYRTIVNLNIIEGYKHTEIAEMLGISEGTSRSQLKRAKDSLKKALENQLLVL